MAGKSGWPGTVSLFATVPSLTLCSCAPAPAANLAAETKFPRQFGQKWFCHPSVSFGEPMQHWGLRASSAHGECVAPPCGKGLRHPFEKR
jgi:hypothetical protein